LNDAFVSGAARRLVPLAVVGLIAAPQADAAGSTKYTQYATVSHLPPVP
jgi:hypothetical protein